MCLGACCSIVLIVCLCAEAKGARSNPSQAWQLVQTQLRWKLLQAVSWVRGVCVCVCR